MANNAHPFIKRGDQEHPKDKSGTLQISRIYPIDDYEIPPQILSHATRYHFIRVPLLGQHNPVFESSYWCGRTSATMLWNYHQLVAGKIQSRDDYITHWQGPDAWGQMDLRFSTGEIAFDNYVFQPPLEETFGALPLPAGVLADSADRQRRIQEAKSIRSSLESQRSHLDKILKSVANNNPVLLYTGLSVSYGGHIILVCGFCEMPDSDGSLKLWLLIADPAPPKISDGPRCTPVNAGDEKDCEHLDKLSEGKNSLVSIVNGNWTRARGYLYLMRASKLFEQNTHVPENKTLWLDYLNGEQVGGYLIRKPTPTPLDPRLVLTRNVVNSICFPLQENPYVPSSPISHYVQSEMAGTGFYPLGTNQSLHGGIHLPAPASTHSPVKSIAPGYIVAARLSKKPTAKPVLDFLNNYNGFVLVRHEVVISDTDSRRPTEQASGRNTQKSAPTPVPFYSLYMHMPPTQWPEEPGDPYMAVPWISRFYLARYGAVVNLDTQRGSIGQILWAAEKPDHEADTCSIYESPKDLNQKQKLQLRDKQRYLGYIKTPPGDLTQAYKALEDGAVVTFSKPFLTMNHGDVLGFVHRNNKLKTAGCLHWELLAPASQENALEKLWKQASRYLDIDLPAVAEVGEDKQDNFIEASELDSLLKDKLPTENDKEFLEHLQFAISKKKHDGFRKALGRFMGGDSSFAKQSSEQQFTEPEFVGTRGVKQLYAISLDIDNGQYRIAPSCERPAPYSLTVHYYTQGPQGRTNELIAKARVEVLQHQLEQEHILLNLKVPANAETLELISPDFHLDIGTGAVVDTTLARSLIQARWRGVSLKHVSEWSPAGLEKLVPKLCEQNLLPTPPEGVKKAIADVLPTAWYGVERGTLDDLSKSDIPVEIPILGPDGQEVSLFDESKGLLPAKQGAGEVLNVHPVTFLWLLKLLQEMKYCSLVTEFKQDTRDDSGVDGARPLFWGWFPPAEQSPAVGQLLSVVAIRRDWGSGPVTLVAERVDGASSNGDLEVVTGEYKEGVFAAQVAPSFWGRWKLKVKDHEGASPRAQGNLPPPVLLEIPEPALAQGFEPRKNPKTGLYTAQLHFTESCPESLGGYLLYQFTKVTLPSHQECPEAEHWLLDADGYIASLKNGARSVTRHFALSDYLAKAGEESHVSIALCLAAERFRQACKVPMNVIDLSEDGHSATLTPLGPTSLTALRQCASKVSGAHDATIEIDVAESGHNKALHIKVSTSLSSPLQWTDARLGNNVYATKLSQDDGPFLRQGDHLIGLTRGTDALVSAHFAWSEYRRAAGGGRFKLSRHLADQVEALRSRFGVKMNIQTVSPDGLTVGLRCQGWKTNKDRLATLAKQQKYRKNGQPEGSFETVEIRRLPLSGVSDPKQPEVLVLSVKEQPVDTSGWLQFEFDPRDTFAEILRQATPTSAERVLLRAAFVVPNGHRIEVYEGPSRSPVEVPWGFAAAPSPRAEVAGIFKTLAWPGFEPMQLSVVGRRLVIRVPLRGARRDWLNARPVISVDDKAYPVTPSGAGLELKLPLSALQKGEVAHADKTLSLEARITNEEALFDGERIAIAPLSLRVTTFPQLVKPLEVHQEQPGRLKLSACVRCCPTDASSLKVLCTLADDPGHPANSALSKRPIESFVQNARVIYADATPDALSRLEGRFEAELDGGHLEPGRTYRFELRPSSEDRTLFGIPVIPLHSAPYETPTTAEASP